MDMVAGISEEELYMHGMSGLSVRRLAHPYLSKPNIPLNGDPPTAHQVCITFTPVCFFFRTNLQD